MTNHRPTEAEELIEGEGNAGRMAAQIVIQHLRALGPSARVLILAETAYALSGIALRGPNGLLTLYGNEFPGVHHTTQMNHRDGGQVQLLYAVTGGGRAERVVQGGIFTMIWCERAEKPSERLSYLLYMAQKHMKTGTTVLSSDGIAQV